MRPPTMATADPNAAPILGLGLGMVARSWPNVGLDRRVSNTYTIPSPAALAVAKGAPTTRRPSIAATAVPNPSPIPPRGVLERGLAKVRTSSPKVGLAGSASKRYTAPASCSSPPSNGAPMKASLPDSVTAAPNNAPAEGAGLFSACAVPAGSNRYAEPMAFGSFDPGAPTKTRSESVATEAPNPALGAGLGFLIGCSAVPSELKR